MSNKLELNKTMTSHEVQKTIEAYFETRRAAKPKIVLDYDLIEDVEVAGIDTSDYPDFCDAYIASATYDGREMTEAELETLNEDSDFVYAAVERKLY